MSRVRGKGNKSTELVVAEALRQHRVTGWRRHLKHLPGRPDFYFPSERLALFVDGCFWHACPTCARRWPHTRTEFWVNKIEGNRRRDLRVRRHLRAAGVHTMRVWEHELRSDAWIHRLARRLERIRREERPSATPPVVDIQRRGRAS
jgi:DNA mismatch endonuclease (patch repair protein)